jgi:MSHA biogenesis protein MshK
MAQRLSTFGAALVLALGASSTGQAARAQALNDPMRPPLAAASGAAESAPGASRLQSVLISPTRRLALIDGRLVPLGGKVGDATVVAITESGVVLKKNGESEKLQLLSGVEIKPVPRMKPPKVVTK